MRRGFTLLELLVVVVTIALLTAMALPVIVNSRKSAWRSHCINNLRQLFVATMNYCSDYDDRYPVAFVNDYYEFDPIRYSPCFRMVVGPYISVIDAWRCPSDTGETWPLMPGGFEKRTPPLYKRQGGTSYEYFGMGMDVVLPRRYTYTIKQPTRVILLLEPRPWHGNPKQDDTYYTSKDKFNVLYCDGHVSQRLYPEIIGDRQYALMCEKRY